MTDEAITPESKINCGKYWYGGPFATDQTGGHTSGHGNGCCEYDDVAGGVEEHRRVWDTDKFQIDRAHLVFAYIEDCDAFGTLVEIGYAAAKVKPVVIGFSEDMSHKAFGELWLCRMLAAKVYSGSAAGVWNEVARDWIVQ